MGAFDSFMTGFLKGTTKNITERKDEAKEYYDKKMELAFDKAHEFRTRNKGKMDAALMQARQLKAIGVPDDVVMAIANQNPEDLGMFYGEIQKHMYKGVKFDENTYRSIVQVHGEVGGDETITGLLTRMYSPLSGNIEADPEGFEFDPKGTFWASAMGFNAMERANQKLQQTEVLPGVSAADVLAYDGSPNTGIMGDVPVTLNAGALGEESRAVEDTGFSDSDVSRVWNDFQESSGRFAPVIGNEHPEWTPDQIIAESNRRAANEMLDLYGPNVMGLAPIAKYLSNSDETTTGVEAGASPSPTGTPTAASPQTATPTPETPTTAPSGLPAGAVLIKTFPNGDKGYETPDGKRFIVKSKGGRSLDPTIEEAIQVPTGN